MKNREFVKGVCTGIAAVLVFTAGARLIHQDSVLSDRSHVKKLEYLERMIDRYYLEEKDEEKLAEGLYTGLLYGLGDPYSRYYTPEEYEEENTATQGSYVGIGIVMQKNVEGGVLVVECYEGGPGDKAGLKAGDIISEVDGTDVTEMETAEVASMIKESKKEQVALSIHREGVKDAIKLTVPIEDVELPSVFHEMLEDKKTGYIRITEFKGVTYEQYKSAFSELEEEGMEQLVIDLRGNPGGLLTSVCDILNEILPERLIVYTEDKYGNRQEEKADGKHTLEIPLAVLVNESSASASEIFAGAVQDHEVGVIVGTTTYGKGVVQSIQPLSDGSAVKLTISRYYTPKGHTIHEKGITPDVEVKLDNSLLNQSEISHEEDNQLQAALQALS